MMLRPGGYGVLTDGIGTIQETDTYTCNHCSSIVTVQPRCPPSDAGGWCSICSKLICTRCLGQMSKGNGCTPWEKRMEQMEQRQSFLRSVGL